MSDYERWRIYRSKERIRANFDAKSGTWDVAECIDGEWISFGGVTPEDFRVKYELAAQTLHKSGRYV